MRPSHHAWNLHSRKKTGGSAMLLAGCHALDALPDNCQLVIQPGAPSNELKDQVFWLHGL